MSSDLSKMLDRLIEVSDGRPVRLAMMIAATGSSVSIVAGQVLEQVARRQTAGEPQAHRPEPPVTGDYPGITGPMIMLGIAMQPMLMQFRTTDPVKKRELSHDSVYLAVSLKVAKLRRVIAAACAAPSPKTLAAVRDTIASELPSFGQSPTDSEMAEMMAVKLLQDDSIFGLMTPAGLEAIADFCGDRPLLSVNAGRGLIEAMLAQLYGVRVVATDAVSSEWLTAFHRPAALEVEGLPTSRAIERLSDLPGAMLFISWPPLHPHHSGSQLDWGRVLLQARELGAAGVIHFGEPTHSTGSPWLQAALEELTVEERRLPMDFVSTGATMVYFHRFKEASSGAVAASSGGTAVGSTASSGTAVAPVASSGAAAATAAATAAAVSSTDDRRRRRRRRRRR